MDYITLLNALGPRSGIVIYKHALRNALLPVVTFVGLSTGFIFSVSVVTETIFARPGMVRLSVEFAPSRDYPALMSLSMIIVLMVYFANLCTDIAYAFLNPKIRY